MLDPANVSLMQLRKGLEKESLRVTPDGVLSQQAHPLALGSALTHGSITTDYSEALLEFITKPHDSTEAMLAELDDIQRYTYSCIGDEVLWGASMPCMLTRDDEIPVGRYGSSNPGVMKTIYRLGLGVRYGRSMQTIAGIHYNFSVQDEFWQFWHEREGGHASPQAYRNRRYFDLIRNFRRYFWLLLYFFGASPAVCRSFVKGREHSLQAFGEDDHSLHLPHATSLRMGDLGYQSDAQSSLVVSYNDLSSYVQTLCAAIRTPHQDYVDKGLKDAQGRFQQLNTSLLQIENEFYSTIRPKCVAQSGETALSALSTRGVDYIEVRCVDLNPYEPLGICAEQIHFMDVFLVYCLLADSPETDAEKYRRSLINQKLVVARGREPGLRLQSACGELSLAQWGAVLLDEMAPVAALLDQSQGSDQYTKALEAQRLKLTQPELTPSSRLLQDMRDSGETFFRLARRLSEKHAADYRQNPLSDNKRQRMELMAAESLQEQSRLERQPQVDFTRYLEEYYEQYTCCF